MEDVEYVDETVVREHLRGLGTGECEEDLHSLVPDGDYALVEVDPWELDAWAAHPDKVTALVSCTGDYPAVILGEDEHVYDGNHRILAARARGDARIDAYVAV